MHHWSIGVIEQLASCIQLLKLASKKRRQHVPLQPALCVCLKIGENVHAYRSRLEYKCYKYSLDLPQCLVKTMESIRQRTTLILLPFCFEVVRLPFAFL
jgi:hypothetical protein